MHCHLFLHLRDLIALKVVSTQDFLNCDLRGPLLHPITRKMQNLSDAVFGDSLGISSAFLLKQSIEKRLLWKGTQQYPNFFQRQNECTFDKDAIDLPFDISDVFDNNANLE